MQTVALIPVKDFADAKKRLAGVLTQGERSALAEAMLRDVVVAATGAAEVDRVVLLGGADARRLAGEENARWLDDGGARGLNAALTAAVGAVTVDGIERVFVLPGDLPTVQTADLDTLLACHRDGLTLNPATRDGGTNALVISPPDKLPFCFGPDSARRHLAAALEAGVPAQAVSLPAFTHDVDDPDDLEWLASQNAGINTTRWLQSKKLGGRSSENSGSAVISA
jgi:2-phospho-L-lactate guanylyltransferase